MTEPENGPDAPNRTHLDVRADEVAIMDFLQDENGAWSTGEVAAVLATDTGLTFQLTDVVVTYPSSGWPPKISPKTLGPYAPDAPVRVSRPEYAP